MTETQDEVLMTVADIIRRTINEEWIFDTEIVAETRFNEDLELESIEFVKIAQALQQHYGTRLDIAGWLAGKTIHELIHLNVGALVAFIGDCVSRS